MRRVVRFLQGQLGADELLAKASNVGESTEAHTYVAFKLQQADRQEDAVQHLQWVAEHGAKNYLEYDLATGEIARLKHLAIAPAGAPPTPAKGSTAPASNDR